MNQQPSYIAISPAELERLTLNTKEIFTVTEAATYTGLSPDSIRSYCNDKKIPYSKPEGRIFIRRSDLIEWMSSRRVESSAGMQLKVANR